jgi:disulfide bond formation protein DsbB
MRFAMTVALLAAAAPLIAIGSEIWPGLAPCALCLWQRWPYWVAAGLAALAVALPPRARRVALAVAGLAVLGSGAVAALHVGVEFGWWPSPLPACLVPQAMGMSVDDLLRGLPAAPTKPCDEAAYFFDRLPLSVAQMNLIYAALLGGFTLRGAWRNS